MSPFLSQAQNRWGHSKAGLKALGGEPKVKEWEKSTDYKSLPERKKRKERNAIVRKAIKAKVK